MMSDSESSIAMITIGFSSRRVIVLNIGERSSNEIRKIAMPLINASVRFVRGVNPLFCSLKYNIAEIPTPASMQKTISHHGNSVVREKFTGTNKW